MRSLGVPDTASFNKATKNKARQSSEIGRLQVGTYLRYPIQLQDFPRSSSQVGTWPF